MVKRSRLKKNGGRKKPDRLSKITKKEILKNFDREVDMLDSGKYAIESKEYDKILQRIALLSEIAKRKGFKLDMSRVY